MCCHVVYMCGNVPHMGRTSISLPFNGQKLLELRQRRGWFQIDLETACKAAGHRVTRDRISRYERGDALPSPRVLKALADGLNVPVDELLDQRAAA